MGTIHCIVCSQLKLPDPPLHGRHTLGPLWKLLSHLSGVKFIKQDLKDLFFVTSASVYLKCIFRVNSTCVQCPWQPEEGARLLGAGVICGYGPLELRSCALEKQQELLLAESSPIQPHGRAKCYPIKQLLDGHLHVPSAAMY